MKSYRMAVEEEIASVWKNNRRNIHLLARRRKHLLDVSWQLKTYKLEYEKSKAEFERMDKEQLNLLRASLFSRRNRLVHDLALLYEIGPVDQSP
eukprot:CAMPEP_0175039056 /NCGR_PEP_ID=MMETSP0052_2-20121109/296_1 /TAXON_ID=51329 ORGANISM="Polytomella parva, Strain SAG 63-3" /NCGR_SAMPLE_ID=MMETSP0052_2 /ASSEMBLY_ACC=CAM_ASM_000194 /LENGTH=93 /DNA_ID=CAMNT_0016300715 /DNA_START=112 /DNA_END=390 /DNA_ORIENTATION=+